MTRDTYLSMLGVGCDVGNILVIDISITVHLVGLFVEHCGC